MKKTTIDQNDRACAKAWALFYNGNIKDARKACSRVHFAYLQLQLAEVLDCDREQAFSTAMALKGLSFKPTD
jgi:hypothetical protein